MSSTVGTDTLNLIGLSPYEIRGMSTSDGRDGIDKSSEESKSKMLDLLFHRTIQPHAQQQVLWHSGEG